MSSSLRRGALAAAAIAFSIASLAACGAGNDSQTLEIKPDNAATSVGDIKIQNALIITQPNPKSTGPAVVSVTIFNTGTTPQTLDSISVEGDGTAQISPAQGKGKVTVPAGGSVVLGGKGNSAATLNNPGIAVADGNAQKITFTFSKTGDVALRAYVVPAESYFSAWGPSNIPSLPASGSPSASTTASPSTSSSPGAPAGSKPSKSASGKPSGSASAHASTSPKP
ncbi:lipoprotein [Streptomyces hygroscopicus]|uniref:copper chaperone PCu(A)C n=1 Tax=Streptomyces hygroscopicus TaxID=1912 RepID=UPI00223F8B22|nr:copper chaperone PCu(A)C [Streptomyces hygroscopicus]MCW7942301.1 lipoprotein [Streptomyces hygroscopicus]